MNTEELKEHWKESCTDFVEKDGLGVCAIMKFMFTYGLVTGLGEYDFKGRWCYGSYEEAKIALKYYEGDGDPPGLWIKYKGEGGEYGNAYRPDFNHKIDVASPHYKLKANGYGT